MRGEEPSGLSSPLPEPDAGAMAVVAARAGEVIRPGGALERLDRVAVWLAGWQGRTRPAVERPAAVVFAADHGVAAAAPVSAYPTTVTAAMVSALRTGQATAAVMARALGVDLSVVDVGVGRPTGDIRVEPALDGDRFRECWEAGREAVAGLSAPDLLLLGEMGIGNTTAAAAVCATLYGGGAETWTGRGTGVEGEGLAVKLEAVARASARAHGLPPLEVLRQVGGGELVALAGALLEARLRSLPVVLDGFVVTASAAVLERQRAGALAHVLAGHRSPEPGHRRLLDRLGLEPLLDLGLRLGEGSGALAALPLVRLAALAVTEVATFPEAGVGG